MATRPAHRDPRASEPAGQTARTEPADPARSAPWRKSRRSPAGPGTACVEGLVATLWPDGSVTIQFGSGAPIFLRAATPEAVAASAPPLSRDTPKAVTVTVTAIEPPRTEAVARPAAWLRGSRDAAETAGSTVDRRTGLVGVGFGTDADSDIDDGYSASDGELRFDEPPYEAVQAVGPTRGAASTSASVRDGVGFEATQPLPEQERAEQGLSVVDPQQDRAVPVTDHADPTNRLDQPDRLDPSAREMRQEPPAIVETSPEGEPTLLLSAGGNEPPPVTRLRVPRDTVVHAEAAAAIPRAVGWKTLLAHSRYGAQVDGERPLAVVEGEHPLTAAELAGRLETADGGFEGVVMVVCDAAADAESGPAAALHAQTGGTVPVLAPTREAIMSPDGDGDVLSGTWRARAPREFEPVPVGGWVLFKDGRSTRYDTPSLRRALDAIGVEAVSGGRPPEQAVSFIDRIFQAQTNTLDEFAYEVSDDDLRSDATPDSFYRALIQTGAVGPVPATDEGLREAAGALRNDIADNVELQWDARYRNLAIEGRSAADVVALLRDPDQWTFQHDLIVPHAAANLLLLELGVLGREGIPEAVGDSGRDRRGDANADPFLLVRLADRYVAARPSASQAPLRPRELQPQRQPEDPSPWTAPRTQHEENRIRQMILSAPLPAGDTQRARDAYYSAMRESLFNDIGHVDPPDRDAINRALKTYLGNTVYSRDEAVRDTGIRELNAAQRVMHTYAASNARIERRSADYERTFVSAGGLAPGEDIAQRARAAADALTEIEYFQPIHQAREDAQGQPGPAPIAALIQGVREHAEADADPSDRDAFHEAVNAALNDQQVSSHVDALAASVARYATADQYARRQFYNRARVAAETAYQEIEQEYIDRIAPEAWPVLEWQIRQDNALADLWVARPDRFLPWGFGQLGPDGRVNYPMGRAGRFVRFGNLRMSDHGGVADLLAQFTLAGLRDGRVGDPDAVRAAHGDRYDDLHAAIRGYLDDFGETAFAQRLLEDGLELEFGEGGRREAVRLRLDLNYDRANQSHPNVGERDAFNVRTGVGWSNPVESPHESAAASVRSIGRDYAYNGSGNFTVPVGTQPAHAPNRVFSVQPGATVAAADSRSHSFGETATSATRRLFETSGRTAFFDFPRSTLRAEIPRPAGGADAVDRSGRLNVRFGFPEDLSPLKPADAVPGALAEERAEAGLPVLGVDRARLADEAEPEGPLHRAADRVAAVPHEFFIVPESIAGLRSLRDEVIDALGGEQADRALVEHVHFHLGERSALEMLNDMAGPGWTSPLLVGADGRQLRMTTTARLRDAAPLGVGNVPLREESQRFVNFSAGSTDGDSATVTPGATLTHIFGNLRAPLGGSYAVSAGGTWTGRMSSTHATSANLGSAHWSGLVYSEGSVLYRATYHMAVRLESTDRPSTAVARDVTVYLRLPEHQRARFEAALADQAGENPLGRATYPRDVDERPIADDLSREQLADEERERWLRRHPPLTLAAGRGIGPSAISHLAGSEQVLPELLERARRVSAQMSWQRGWDAMEVDQLRTELASRFTPEGLINWGSALFQDGGVRMEFTRPAKGGREVITFTVRGLLDPERQVETEPLPRPFDAGRISNARLDFMPIGFAGHGASEAVGRGSTWLGQGTVAIGIGTHGAVRTVGGALGYQRVRDTTDTLSVGPSSFLISAVLHDGPVRYFDYRVAYELEVTSRHEAGYNFVDQVSAAPALATGLAAGRSVAQQTAAPTLRHTIRDGRARFVTIEKLAPIEPADPAAASGIGIAQELPIPVPRVRYRVTPTPLGGSVLPQPVTAPSRRTALPPEVTVVVPPAVGLSLDSGGHVPLHADDQVTEVLGGSGMAEVLVRLLDELDVPRETYGHTPWMLTSTENLTASQVRGPSEIRHTLFVGGPLGDRRVVITLTGFAHRVEVQRGTEDVPIFRMSVAESGAAVSSATFRSFTDSIRGAFNLGLLDRHGDSGTETTTPSFSGAWNIRDEAVSRSTAVNPVTGRLVQSDRLYRALNGDMRWRISVVAYSESTILNSEPKQAHALLDMPRGISFLRLAVPLPDPRLHSEPRPDLAPDGVPRRLTVVGRPQDAGLHDGSLAVSTIPATPGSTVRVPRVPLVPAGAVSELLMAPRPTHLVHEATGEGSPLYDAVRSLVAEHASNFLDHYWTAEELPGGNLVRHLPATLRSLFDPGSQEALLDQMLGSGLRLTATAPSAFGGTDRLQLLIRATRGDGYRLVDYVDNAVISRYHFRLHSTTDSSAHAPGHSAGLAGAPIFRDARSEPSHLQSANAGGGANFTSTVTRGHALTRTDAVRETPFTRGPAARYVGEVSINVSLTKTFIPSHAAEAVGYGQIRDMAGRIPGVGDRDVARPNVDVTMLERVIIPVELLRDDTPRPAGAPELPAVREVPTHVQSGTLGYTPFRMTSDELRRHDAYVISADPAKIRVLSDSIVDRLSGAVLPDGGAHSAAVARLFEDGTLSETAARTLMSHPMFTRQLELMLTDSGFTSPVLVREGGVFGDTHGRMTIRVELLNPHMRGYTAGSHDTVDYGFRQYDSTYVADSNRNTNANAGAAVNLGEPERNLNSNLPGHETFNASAGATLGQSVGGSGTGTLKAMPRQRSRNRDGQWLIVDADMRVHVEVTAETEEPVAASFLVRDGMQLALSPESALEHGLIHPRGLTLPTGVFVAAHGSPLAQDSIVRDIHEAHSLRGVHPARHFVVDVRLTQDGDFVVGDAILTAEEFHRQVLAGRDLTGRILVLTASRADHVDFGRALHGRRSPAEALAVLTGRPVLAANSGVGLTRDGALRTFREGPQPMGPLEQHAEWILLTHQQAHFGTNIERSSHGNELEEALVRAEAQLRPSRPVSGRREWPTEFSSPPSSRPGSRRASMVLGAIPEATTGRADRSAPAASERSRGKRKETQRASGPAHDGIQTAVPEDLADLSDEDVREEFFDAQRDLIAASDARDHVRRISRGELGTSGLGLAGRIEAAERTLGEAGRRYGRAQVEMERRGISDNPMVDLPVSRPAVRPADLPTVVLPGGHPLAVRPEQESQASPTRTSSPSVSQSSVEQQPTSGRIPLVEGDAGAAGFEAELHDFHVVLPPGAQAGDYDTVVASPHLRIVLDQAGEQTILEVVSRPARILAGARDDGRADRADVLADLQDVLHRLRGAQDNQPLESVFPRDAGYSVESEASDIRVRQPDSRTDRLFVHYTVGIPVSGLRDFLAYVQEGARARGISSRYARLRLADALGFGERAGTLFAGWLTGHANLPDGGRAEDQQAVEGFMAYTYAQVAAAAQAIVTPGPLPKNFSAAVSRMPLAAVRADLSPVVQEFLEVHAEDLAREFVGRFGSRTDAGQVVEGILDRRLAARWSGDLARPTATVGEYLDNALRRDPAVRLSQSQALGVRTDFDELDANRQDGAPLLDPPLVLLELRTFGSERAQLAELQSEYAGLEAHALHAYNEARALRGRPLVGRPLESERLEQPQEFVPLPVEERLTREVNRRLDAADYRPLTWPEIQPYVDRLPVSEGPSDVSEQAAGIADILMGSQRARRRPADADQQSEDGGSVPSHAASVAVVSAAERVDGLAWWRPDGEPGAVFAQRYGWLTQVNDNEGDARRAASSVADSEGWLVNCALAAMATHMSIADEEAGPFIVPPVDEEAPHGLPLTDLENYANDSRGPVAAGVAPRALRRVAGYAEIVEAVEQAGEGAHGFVVVAAAGDKTGHVFNVVNDGDGVVFLDGQTGRQAELPDDGSDIFFVPVGGTEIDVRGTGSKVSAARMVEQATAPAYVGRDVPRQLTGRTAARNAPASASATGAGMLRFADEVVLDLGQNTAGGALLPRFAGAPLGVGWAHALWAQSWGLRFDQSVGSLYDALLTAGGGTLAVGDREIGDAGALQRALGRQIGETAPSDNDLSRAAARLGMSVLILRENGTMSSHGWGPALVVAEAVGEAGGPAWVGLPAAAGDASLLGGLSGAQIRWAADARMRFVAQPDSELGGDLFGALIAADRATAAPALRGEPADLRGRLVRLLRTGAQSANEAWDSLVADGRVPRGDSAEARERFAASVQQGRNDEVVSSLLPPLASRLFGIAMRVVDSDGATLTYGDSGAASVLTLAQTVPEGSSFDAAPIWVPLAEVRPAQVSGAGTRPADVAGGRSGPDSATATATATTPTSDIEAGLDAAGASGAQREWARDNGRRLVEVPDGLSAAILRSVGGAVFVRGVYVEDPARLRELIADDVSAAQQEDPGLSLVAHTVYAGLDGESAPDSAPGASSDARINSGRALAEMIDAIAMPGARPELADELLPFFANRLGLGVRVVDPSGVIGRYGRGRPAYIAWSAGADGTRRWMAAPQLPSRYALRSPLRAPNLSDPVLVQLARAIDARRATLRADGADTAADAVIVGLRDARNAWLANGVRSRQATADASAAAVPQRSAELVQDTVALRLQATEAVAAPETGGALGTGVALSQAIGLLGALFPAEHGESGLGPAATVEESGPVRGEGSPVGITADEWITATLPDLVGVLPVGGAALFLGGGRTLALVDTDTGHRLVDFGLDQAGQDAADRVFIPSTASMAAAGSGLALVMDSAGRTVPAQDLPTELGHPVASAVGWSTEPGSVAEQDVPATRADADQPSSMGVSSSQAAWALEHGALVDEVESGPNGLFTALLRANGGRFAARGTDSADAAPVEDAAQVEDTEQVEDATRLRHDVAGHLRERASAPGALRALPSIAAAFAFEGAQRIVEEYFDRNAAAADLRALDRQLAEHIETGQAVEFIAKALEEPGHWERITRWPALDALADWAGVTIFVVGQDGGVHRHGELTGRRLAVASIDTGLTEVPGWAALVPQGIGGDAAAAMSGFEDVTADTVSSLDRSIPAVDTALDSAAELGELQRAAAEQHGLTALPTAPGSMFDAFLGAAGGAIQIGRDAQISGPDQLRQTLAELLRDRPDVLTPATRQRVDQDMRDAGLIDGRTDAQIAAEDIDEALRAALDGPATLGAEAYAPHLIGAYLGVELNILGSDGEISTYGTGRPVYIAGSFDVQTGEERWSALVAPPRTPEVERRAEKGPDGEDGQVARGEEIAREIAERTASSDLGEIARTPWHPKEFTLVQPTENRSDDPWRSSTFCVADAEGKLACVNVALLVLDHQLAQHLGVVAHHEGP